MVAGLTLNTSYCTSHTAEAPAALKKTGCHFPVQETRQISHNTRFVRFALPSSDHKVGLPVASCLTVSAKIDGKNVVRCYTPLNLDTELGHLDLLVKVYPEGVMSRHIGSLKVGDELQFKGPWPKLQYEANKFKKIGLIAGGTGVAPMLQLARQIVRNPHDHTEVTLLFANVTEDDILLRDELLAMQHLYPNFRVVFTVEKPEEGWGGETGRVNAEMVNKYMPSPDEGGLVCVCGPPPMMSAICGKKASKTDQGPLQGVLKATGHEASGVYKF